MSIEEFIILVFGFLDNNMIEGKTRFQKIFYLLNKEFNISDKFKFFRYYYGPYSEILENAIVNLKFDEFIKEEIIYLNDFQSNYQINRSLTEKGISRFNELKKTPHQNKIEDIEKMVNYLKKEKFLEMKLADLLKIVYEKAGYT